MSEITTVGGDPSIQPGGCVLDTLTEMEASTLYFEARDAIKGQNFDRAREIITRLSQVYYQAQAPKGWIDTFRGWISGEKCPISETELYLLFSDLCRENREEGEKLIPVLEKIFSIKVDGNHYQLISREDSYSFRVPIQTTSKAKALIDHLSKLNQSRKYEDLKKELPRLAELCKEQKVTLSDFKTFYKGLVFLNSSFAVSCFPIFINVYLIYIQGDYVYISDEKSSRNTSFRSNHLSFVDCDRNLERIAGIKDPLDRLWKYYFLARHQMERAPEVMKKAEEQLDLLEDSKERFSGHSTIMSWYCDNHDHENFERIAEAFEKELLDAQEISHYYLAETHCYRALSCLEKKDYCGYIESTEKLVQAIKHVREETAIEYLQLKLRTLKTIEAETFPLGWMEWQAMKA